MSINKIYLPGVQILEDYLSTNGSSSFNIRFVRNKDAFIGPSESIKFIERFSEKYYNDIIDTEFTQVN